MSRKTESQLILQRMRYERWLTRQLGRQGEKVHQGVSTPDQRRDRVRRLLLRERLGERLIPGLGRRRTWSEAFQRVYGEPLITNTMRLEAEELRGRQA